MLEDESCKDCGRRWTWAEDVGWILQFETGPDPKQRKLLWVQCWGCQSEEDRFAASVAADIHWLPLTDHD